MNSGGFASYGPTAMPKASRSWLSLGKTAMKKTLPNIHTGEVLFEEFLKPMGISKV